jgi:hypothetical protein
LPYYIAGTVIDSEGFRYSTPIERVDPAALGIDVKDKVVPYDGCVEWGGFEAGHIAFLRLHGHAVPALSVHARTGKQAALLKAGKTTLAPILFTSGVAHRLSCWLKADKDADVTVALTGTFDGKSTTESKPFKAGKQWTEVGFDFRPPAALSAGLRVTIIVPAGSTLLVDDVSFRPR